MCNIKQTRFLPEKNEGGRVEKSKIFYALILKN